MAIPVGCTDRSEALEGCASEIEGMGPGPDLARFYIELGWVKHVTGADEAARVLAEKAADVLREAPDPHMAIHLQGLRKTLGM